MRISSPNNPRDRLLAAVFDASPEAMVLIDYLKFNIVDVNNSFCELLGYERERIIGVSYYDLDLWVEDDLADNLLEQLRTAGEATLPNARVKDQRGTEKTLHMLIRMVVIDGRDYVLAAGHDVTAYSDAKHSPTRWIDLNEQSSNVQARIGSLGDTLTDYVTLLQGLNEPLQKESALRQLQVLCATCMAQIDMLLVDSATLSRTLETSKIAKAEAEAVEQSGDEKLFPPQVIELTTKITSFLTELLKLFGV